MKTTTKQKPIKTEKEAVQNLKNKTETILIFGQEVENKKYELKELVAMMRARFETNDKASTLPVGNMAYYGLAFRHLKLVDMSYQTLADIIAKIFELNNQRTDTTAKCMAWYQGKIKQGKVNIHEDFKPTTRTKTTVDISSLF